MAYGPAPLPPLSFFFDTQTYEPGLFSLTRSDNPALYSTQLRVGRKAPAAYGSFALTGQDATLDEDAPTPITAAPLPMWSFLTLGTSGVYVMPSETGTVNLAGQDAALRKGRGLAADSGSFAASGAPAERDTEVNADVRLFQVVGRDATLRVNPRTLTAAQGAFSLTGGDASFSYEQVGARRLDGQYGAFSMSRTDLLSLTQVSMTAGRSLSCAMGSFAVTGRSAGLSGPVWTPTEEGSGAWVYVTPSGGVWTDVDPDS